MAVYDKIGVIGAEDTILAFKAVGADVFGTTDPEKAMDTIKACAKSGYAVLFLQESLALELESFLERYKSMPYPAIIPIPTGESSGYGMHGLKKDVERAIGADILFNDGKQ